MQLTLRDELIWRHGGTSLKNVTMAWELPPCRALAGWSPSIVVRWAPILPHGSILHHIDHPAIITPFQSPAQSLLLAQVELCVMSLVARYDVFHALSSLHPSLTLAVPTPHPHTHTSLHKICTTSDSWQTWTILTFILLTALYHYHYARQNTFSLQLL